MRSIKTLTFVLLAIAILVACSKRAPSPAEETRSVREPLIAQGQRCIANSQCQTGFCVDTVCCENACGFGARDAVSCSNVYGVVPGLVEGKCTNLVPGNPCGSLVSFNPCSWRGSNINGGGNCPAPGNEQTFACQACTTSADCPAGLPVCIANGCTACTADFGVASTTACPTSALPACVNGACMECSQSNATACTGNRGSCDVDLNVCVGCSGNFGSPPGPSNKFPCTQVKPACLTAGINAGACVECSSNDPTIPVVCTQDPTKTVCDLGANVPPSQGVCVNCLVSSTCPSNAPVCTNKQCTPCNGNRGSGATSSCPTPEKPACVPSPVGPGTCEECSASDATRCAQIPGKPVCDAVNSVCVECNTGPDCAGVPGRPFCNNHVCTSSCVDDTQCGGTTPRCKNGLCVACIDDTTCSGATPFCDVSSSTCVECLSFTQCATATKPVCGQAGACVKCDGDNGSASSNPCPTAAAPACNIATGACVQCNAGNTGLCTGATPVCNVQTNQCVECTDSGDCVATGPRPVCNTATSTCAACNADNATAGAPPAVLACPTALLPACAGGSCFECKDGAGPPAGTNVTACTPGEPICKDATHQCVQCLSNAQCAGSAGICNLQTNTCGPGCATDANCSAPTPRCKALTAACVQCLDFTDCGGATPQCDTTTNTCVECVSNAQCSGARPRCAGGRCVPCNGDFGSGASNACLDATTPACLTSGVDAGRCVQCSNSNTTRCVAPTPACNTTSHTCVECSSNAQCSGAKPICNNAGACVACNGDLGSGASAACTTAAAPACLLVGPNAGTCVECSGANLSACTSAKPVCDVAVNLCVQCNSDAQCTGANGKCDLVTHVCTTGCTSDANCSSSAPVCKLPEGICVECTADKREKCVAPRPLCNVPTNTCVTCTSGADCPVETPVCNPTTHTCSAECTDSAQCPGSAPICNPQTKRCVECTQSSQCPSQKPICNPQTGTCGTDCTQSSECPGTAPVCNPQTRKCVQCTDNTQCSPPTPICNTQTGTCGNDCTKNSECPGAAPICNPQTKKCVQCTDNAQCNPAAPICNPQTGTCGNDCTKNADCTGATPICNAATKKCVECNAHSDCPLTEPVCNPTTHACEPLVDSFVVEGGGCGCSTVGDRNDPARAALVFAAAIALLGARRRRR